MYTKDAKSIRFLLIYKSAHSPVLDRKETAWGGGLRRKEGQGAGPRDTGLPTARGQEGQQRPEETRAVRREHTRGPRTD